MENHCSAHEQNPVTRLMTTYPYTHTRNNFPSVMKEADDNREPIVITRSGKPPVVLLSMDEYESMEETLHLLSTPAN